jgi:CheY-like chemotaxis protein
VRCRSLQRDGSLAKQETDSFANKPGLPIGLIHFQGRRSAAAPHMLDRKGMTDDAKARGAHVLVVEDDAVVGPLIVRMLESKGYTATLASDGDAARSAIRLARYDLALADIVLGTQDGHDIAESLVAIQPDVRVVFMSGYGIPRYGAEPNDPMLSKPFGVGELVERVERALAS